MANVTEINPRSNKLRFVAMTDEQFAEFVQGWIDGKIFSAAHLPPRERIQLIPAVFTPWYFIAHAISEEEAEQIAMIWEWVDKAIPREALVLDGPYGLREICAERGLPCFTSMRVMGHEEWSRALKAIREAEKKRSGQ